MGIICRIDVVYNSFLVNLIRFTWWHSLKDQFRNVVKTQKSGSGGTSKENNRVQWQFYHEMSFMKTYIYSRRHFVKQKVWN